MSDVVTSKPPPATEGDAPWGSFYTVSSTAAAPVLPNPAEKVKGRAKRKRSAEPKPKGEKGLRRSRGSRKDRREHAKSAADTAAASATTSAADKPKEPRKSFRLRRGSHAEPKASAPAPVATAAPSRRYAEPHVLVGVVGGTLIALYALAVALLYMIGNAA